MKFTLKTKKNLLNQISVILLKKNDEVSNMIFNRIIDDINKSVENYEEYFT